LNTLIALHHDAGRGADAQRASADVGDRVPADHRVAEELGRRVAGGHADAEARRRASSLLDHVALDQQSVPHAVQRHVAAVAGAVGRTVAPVDVADDAATAHQRAGAEVRAVLEAAAGRVVVLDAVVLEHEPVAGAQHAVLDGCGGSTSCAPSGGRLARQRPCCEWMPMA
jgi:hypothetical protein